MMRLNTVSAVALICAAAPAFAEMDARETWAEWQRDYLFDVQVTAGQTDETDTAVMLTDVVFSVGDPDDGATLTVPGLTIVETDDGGVVATISGNAALRMIMARFDDTQDIVGIDLTTDGASLTVVEGDSLMVAFAAPALGAVMTEAVDRGEPLDLSGSISVGNVAMRYSDTMFSTPTRMIDVSGGFEALKGEMDGTNLDDVAALSGLVDVASWSFDATLDAPMEILDDFFVPDATLISDMTFALDAASIAFDLQPSEDASYIDDVSFDFALDQIAIAHDVIVPLDERDYFNGQDLVADDLEGFIDYAISGLRGSFSTASDSSYGDSVSTTSTDVTIAPTTIGGRIEVDEAGILTRSIQGSLGLEVDFTDVWASDGNEDVSSFSLSIVDLTTDQLASLPLDNAMMAYMQGLPDGVSWRENYSVAEFALEFEESFDQGSEWAYSTAASGSAEALSFLVDLSGARVTSGLSVAAAAGSFLSDDVPAPMDGELSDLSLEFSMPISTGTGSEPYNVTYSLGQLVLGNALWDMADPQGLLDRGPISAQVDVNGMMRATTNPMALATFGMGMSPFVAETMSFSMAVAAVGATVQGVGEFATEAAIAEGLPPVGTADLSGSGIDAVLSAMAELGAMSPDELEEAQFLLEAFTTSDPSGMRRMQVEINDEQHLIVNGQRMQ